MSLILLSSVSGAPGVSTAAVGMSLMWPRPVLLVEADLSTTSRLLPGALRAQVPHDTGLTELLVANSHRSLDEAALWDQAIEIAENVSVLPGFKSISTGMNAGERFWRSLIDTLRIVEARGIDIFIDAGRLMVDDPRVVFIREAESVALFSANTLPAIASVHATLQPGDIVEGRDAGWLRTELEQIGHFDRLDLIMTNVNAPGNTYPARPAAKSLGVELLGSLPWNPRGAAQFTFDIPTTLPKRNAYVRALKSLVLSYSERLVGQVEDELSEEIER